MNKLKKTTIFLVGSGILSIAAAVIMQFFTPFGNIHRKASSGTEYFDNVREIVVVSGSMPVELSYGDSEECEISWVSELPLIVNCDDQGVLHITQDDSFSLSIFSESSAEFGIALKIPRKSYGRISLAASGGRISVQDDISAEVLELSTKTGDIYVFGADQYTKIKSNGGDITAYINSLEGDISISGGEGDVYVNVPPELSFFMEFFTDSGSCITEGFPENLTGRKGDAAILSGKGGNNLKIKTTSGNLRLVSDIKRPSVT